jgi:hypothetical protein
VATGTGAVTLDDATAVASGVMQPSGAGAPTLADATANGSGAETITGTGSSTLANATASGTGSERITGSGASALAAATANGAGEVTLVYLEPGSIDAAVDVNGVGSLERISVVGIIQYIDVPSIDAGSQPVGGWLFADGYQPPVGSGSSTLAAATATGTGSA